MDTERRYAVIISPDYSKATIELDLENWKEDWFDVVKRHAGISFAEVVYPFGQEYPCLIDENGKLRNLSENRKATKLCSGILFTHDYVVGSMVVTHFNGEDDLELLTQKEADIVNNLIIERMKDHD